LGLAAALPLAARAAPVAQPGAAPAGVNWLTKAVRAPARIGYRATETLVTRSGKDTDRVTVRVVHRAPDDTRREYLSRQGRVERIVSDDGHSHWQYLPQRKQIIFSPSVRVDRELWQERHLGRLLANYTVSDGGEAVLGGRPVRALAVAPRSGHHGPSKRLWVDKATGLILKSEVTSADGKTNLSSTLSDLRLEKTIADSEFAPPAHARKQTVIWEHVAVLPLVALRHHWKRPVMVPRDLPSGYRLESARLLRRGRNTFVHLRYFDGLNTLSLFEEPSRVSSGASRQRGRSRARGTVGTWDFDPPFWALTWRERGLKLVLVSDLPQHELLRLAEGMRPPAAKKR
jgi:outer membrane lipoprotein-sorting protein